MVELPANVIIPVQTKDTHIPLYAAIGLSEQQSNKVYFEVKENMVPKCGTVAELLRAIIDSPELSIPEKVWATYNADKLALEAAREMKKPGLFCNGGLFSKIIGK